MCAEFEVFKENIKGLGEFFRSRGVAGVAGGRRRLEERLRTRRKNY